MTTEDKAAAIDTVAAVASGGVGIESVQYSLQQQPRKFLPLEQASYWEVSLESVLIKLRTQQKINIVENQMKETK
ncbi:hypothetical protein HMPREF9162_2309 [Selenomonas sp. oral taxon 137 str. F0430]|uniref:hypothetical protein n=1 Tax=Selenomonas sp. oral taxon 137 TaxID=712531 RepID=UPI0001EB2A03|nr:hypothetical protein [Selenomonas sp. oral taxon 137]EFR40817.1 hypothetical protein HMPREF9162_2309 [Selenomonas sp. oral taxon 137 str. F0430]